MLTLADRLVLGPFTVYRDLVREGGQRRFGNTFYVVPREPRLQRDAGGKPAFRFLWYRSALNAAGSIPGARTGGLVTLTVELGPTAAERAELIRQLSGVTGLALDQVVLATLPVKAGRVEFQFASESGAGELAAVVGGGGPARLTGAQCATFLVELTSDGAALLAALLEAGAPAFHARWELAFDHYLQGVGLRVWCDARRAWARAAPGPAGGALSLARGLCEEKIAGVELLESTPLPDAERSQLLELGQRTLAALLDSTLLAARPGAERPYPEGLDAALNLTLSESYPLEGQALVEGLLKLELSPEHWRDHVREIDLEQAAARWLDVEIVCAVDFESGLVEAIVLRIESAQPGPERRAPPSAEFAFSAASRVAHFRCELAEPSRRSYRARAEVYLRGSREPLVLVYSEQDAELFVIDADGVGVLDVDVRLGNVRPELVRGVALELEYPAERAAGEAPRTAATLLLDAAMPSARWRSVVRDATVGAYRYRVRWTLEDERRLESPWQPTSSRRLIIPEPPDLGEAARVDLVATGSFDDLAELLVDLQTLDGAERSQHAFTRAGECFTWRPRFSDPTRRQYDVRTTLVYSDGIRRELAWERDDRPVLPIRNPLHFEVRITPRLLGLGDVYRMALLEIAYTDAPTGIAREQSFVFRDGAADARWVLRLGAPDRHQYRYRLTLVPASAPRRTGPWQEAAGELLVLVPLGE